VIISALVDDLIRRRVSFEVHGDSLRVRGPAEVLTAELLSLLREHKSRVLAYLASEDGPSHVLHTGECPALTGGVCRCDPILVRRREARSWGWSV
jgi:hypothetical protein